MFHYFRVEESDFWKSHRKKFSFVHKTKLGCQSKNITSCQVKVRWYFVAAIFDRFQFFHKTLRMIITGQVKLLAIFMLIPHSSACHSKHKRPKSWKCQSKKIVIFSLITLHLCFTSKTHYHHVFKTLCPHCLDTWLANWLHSGLHWKNECVLFLLSEQEASPCHFLWVSLSAGKKKERIC